MLYICFLNFCCFDSKYLCVRCKYFDFQPSLDNIHALVHSFTNSAHARKEGLKFQDTIYECVRADRFSVYAKQVSSFLKIK